jgi:glycosyltransferase involved in cell wall biosynthesis
LGLSILIPVYNYPVEGLVKTLSAQIAPLPSSEIIILDDGSSEEYVRLNSNLSVLPAVSFHRNEKNLGRMETRLKLASLARFNHLLFIDADSIITKPDFIAVYMEELAKGYFLITGGRIYSKEAPACEYRLHWKYGTQRESFITGRPAFLSNNFLVKKDIFQKLDHSIRLESYGHEDSWWGMQFEKAGVQFHAVNNPVMHGCLEKSEDFLRKSEQAIENLFILARHEDHRLLCRHIRIYRVYKKLKASGMAGLFLAFEKLDHRRIKKNLLSCNPKLKFFDWYRLALLIKKARQNKSGK